MSAYSMRTMLHQHHRDAPFVSVSDCSGAANRFRHTLRYRRREWQSCYNICDIYTIRQPWIKLN